MDGGEGLAAQIGQSGERNDPAIADALILGAGPAGAECALHLAQKGWRVVVVEKKALDREKSCGGGIQTQEVVEFGEIPAEILERQIGEARIYSPGAGHLHIPQFVAQKGATVKRAVFDVWLQDRARAAGAQFLPFHEAVDFAEAGDHMAVRVATPAGEQIFRARIVVYAVGATTSLLRKKYPTALMNPERLYVAVEKWFAFDDDSVAERVGDVIEIYGGSKVAPGGYGWIFPKKNVLSVGIGTHKKVIGDLGLNLRTMLDDFMYRNDIVSEKLKGGRIVRNDGGLIPAEPLDRLAFPRMVLIGDAGGFGNVLHGGGIFQARKSAKIAAPFIDEFLRDERARHLNDYEVAVKEYFWNYENRWDSKLVRFFWKDTLINRVVSMANSGYADLTRAFAIILNSTESHENAYLLFEQSMLDIVYDFLKEQAKPYRDAFEKALARVKFEKPLLAPAVGHLLHADAKRFRATMAFTAFRLFTQGSEARGHEAWGQEDVERAMPAALAYELLHTASLIHDDIGDNAQKRRGRNCVHVEFGVDAAITAGDALIFKALALLNDADWPLETRTGVMKLFLDSALAVAQGQSLDIYLSRRFEEWSVEGHLAMIQGKTGALIESPLLAGAMIAGANAEQLARLSRIGKALGAAFQIIDDCNDFLRTSSTALKALYTDIREGKCTLALARAYECAEPEEQIFMHRAVGHADASDADLAAVLDLCRKYDSVFFAQKTCGQFIATAEAEIAGLPAGSARDDLAALVDMIGNWTAMGAERSEGARVAEDDALALALAAAE